MEQPKSNMASKVDAVAAASAIMEMSKLVVSRNVAIVCTSILLSYMATSGNRSLQSSLYADNMGNVSLTFFNVGFVVSSLLLPTLFQYVLGLKWSLVVSYLMFVAFPASNLYPERYLMYTCAAISGLAAGPMWSSKSSYLMKLGGRYAAQSGESPEIVNARFFGFFYMFFGGSQCVGNAVSSIVMRRPPSAHIVSDAHRAVVRSVCGAHYCYEDLNVVFGRAATTNGTVTSGLAAPIYHPTTFQINLLFGIYVLCGFLAAPLSAALTPISVDPTSKPLKIVDALLATLRHMKNRKEILLTPLSFLSGVCTGYMTADYCVGFITCSIGIDNVGYVMALLGAVSATFSVTAGLLLKLVGRKLVFAFCGLCNAAVLVWMLAWQPDADSLATNLAFAVLCGISVSGWTTYLVSFIGFVFQDDRQRASAFACNYLWMSIGTSLWHSFSDHLCLYVQIYIIAAILVVGMIGYATLEIMLKAEAERMTKMADLPGTYKATKF